jgi:hypothetical protein
MNPPCETIFTLPAIVTAQEEFTMEKGAVEKDAILERQP